MPSQSMRDLRKDNRGVIKMINNNHSSRRVRHIDVEHHVACDAVEEGLIRFNMWISSLSKVLDMKSSEWHAKALMNAT